MLLVNSTEFSANVSTVDFTLPRAFKTFFLRIKDVVLANDSEELQLRVSFDGGTTFDSATNYLWAQEQIFSTPAAANPGSAVDTSITFASPTAGNQIGNAATEGICVDVWLYSCNKSDGRFNLNYQGCYISEGNLTVMIMGSARHGPNPLVDAIRLLSSGAGGIDRGKVYLYGIE